MSALCMLAGDRLPPSVVAMPQMQAFYINGCSLHMVARYIRDQPRITALLNTLIECGDDVNAHDTMGWTPLHCAVKNRNTNASVAAIGVFIAAGCEVDDKAVDIAARSHSDAALLAFHNAGTDIIGAARPSGSQTPLHIAASMGSSIKPLKLLLSQGAHVNALDQDGSTPLIHAACRPKSSATVVKLLLGAGADVRIKNSRGNTALHTVESAAAAMELIKAGADLRALNNREYTPLMQAIIRQPPEVSDVFIKHGRMDDVLEDVKWSRSRHDVYSVLKHHAAALTECNWTSLFGVLTKITANRPNCQQNSNTLLGRFLPAALACSSATGTALVRRLSANERLTLRTVACCIKFTQDRTPSATFWPHVLPADVVLHIVSLTL